MSEPPRLLLCISRSPLISVHSTDDDDDDDNDKPLADLVGAHSPKFIPSKTGSLRSFSSSTSLPTLSRPLTHSDIASVLDLLNTVSEDVACEVRRVRESVREARVLVAVCKAERRAKAER
jgi:hypothetical protein